MNTLLVLIVLGSAGIIITWLVWAYQYGVLRGSLAILCRVIWILPIILAFFPEVRVDNSPRSVSLKPIHVLLDDSVSMKNESFDSTGKSVLERSNEVLSLLNEECLRLGCLLEVDRLSEINTLTKDGVTPLSSSIVPWLYKSGTNPWILISDGGDYRPEAAWDDRLIKMGITDEAKDRGLILGFRPKDYVNIWLESEDVPLFSFENKPLDISVTLKRESPSLKKETVQVQVLVKDQPLNSINATFGQGEDSVELLIPISALSRGRHLLTIKALPTGEEKAVWDNVVHKIVEVLPNTVGILHLLGSPSWDGRFLRRYLKSEPKYDLISFYILRDPGDIQPINERELSLIPFPVDRLFNEELPNFHSVIIQNFALHQFLDPTYQENLVKFVKDGGGLLFIGGHRALSIDDFGNSALSSIIPFSLKERSQRKSMNIFRGYGNELNKSGPYYDESLSYRVELAQPTKEQKSLANIYDEWDSISNSLHAQTNLKGLHHTEKLLFKEGEYTPLLNARLENGETVPLVVASYPGKGRALWIFSESLYQLALNPNEKSSRGIYQKIMKSAMTWLLREEMKKPLIIRSFKVFNSSSIGSNWQLSLTGSAAKYLQERDGFSIRVCGVKVPMEDLLIEKISTENWTVSGKIAVKIAKGTRCEAIIEGNHEAFGSVKAQIASVVPNEFTDQELSIAPNKLIKLSNITEAKIHF